MRLAALTAALALLTGAAQAQDWVLDRSASSVAIETDVFGARVTGQFSEFDAQITLDPDDLASARIDAVVRTASGEIGNSEYQAAMTGNAGLAPSDHPEARFLSETITRDGDAYAADGTLTIKGVSQPATLRFTLDINDGRAVADGGLTVQRSAFGVGVAGWNGAASEIRIVLHIEANAA